jgi:hypothetical protein
MGMQKIFREFKLWTDGGQTKNGGQWVDKIEKAFNRTAENP